MGGGNINDETNYIFQYLMMTMRRYNYKQRNALNLYKYVCFTICVYTFTHIKIPQGFHKTTLKYVCDTHKLN